MIGILPKFLEVRTVEPRALVQSIELSKPRFIAHDKFIYVASSSHVWRLVPAPLPMQIQQLLNEKQFDLALLLAVSICVICITYFLDKNIVYIIVFKNPSRPYFLLPPPRHFQLPV